MQEYKKMLTGSFFKKFLAKFLGIKYPKFKNKIKLKKKLAFVNIINKLLININSKRCHLYK